MKPFQQYAADGWHVVRGAMPAPLVRELVARFTGDSKASAEPQLRQNGRREPHRLDPNGFMKVPLLDPHIGSSPTLEGFRAAILDLACSADMLKALAAVTLHPRHILQQVMLFEQAATPPHQDWVYLDSFPQGCLTAAWVALEDISPDATRFFVIPGSQDFDREFPRDWIIGSSRYTEAMTEVVKTQYADQVVIPTMNAGDVLFWNSRLIHGSLAGKDPTRSRLSLALHYLPDGFGFGHRGTPLQRAHPLPVTTGRPIPYTTFVHAAPEAPERAPAKRGGWMRTLARRMNRLGVFGGSR